MFSWSCITLGPAVFFLAKPFSWTSFEVKIRLNKAFRFFNFLQKRRGERLSWFSSQRGTFDRGWLSCPRINMDGFWFSPCWACFVRHVKSMFGALNWATCRGCNCSFNELVKLAQVMNVAATWVTEPIRILHEMNKIMAIQLLYKFQLKQPQSNPFVLTAWTDFLKKDGLAFQDFFQI